MADVNANIGVHIDTSAALAELKNLQRQLATFHSSVAKNSAAAAAAQKGLQTNLLNSINATGKFRAQMGLVRTSTESFTHALETNKLSMREYFRYAGGSTKTFGRLFKQEFNTIGKVAEERVKKMQTQYIKMGRDASGAMKAISITPNTVNMKDYSTKLAVAAQKQALLNQLLKQGSTNLLNFGKNTQWAGRQLMVGFTIPLAYFGTAAAKTFMDLEKQAVRFKRVYGDMFTTSDQTNKALAEVQLLAEEFTKYGVAVAKTMEMAASAAAMGKTGADLTAQVAQATRLAVLGGVEQEQALETTISVTNAFGIAAEDLASKINFLNAVENQTVVSIEDLTEAIPKAGPVVKQLGGTVEDLAFFLTAMKEGGINASEGANALKSGLASLINPSEKASKMLASMGINIKAIVEGNAGNIKETVIDFAQALDTLDPLNRARAIEQLFGKFQFSRLSTLFQNVTKEGTQAARVLELAGASIEELAILSERELGVLENAIGTDFKESIEKLKLAIAPIGKEFLKAVTPIAKALGGFLEKFNNLGDGTKKFIVVATTLVGVIGPVLLMTFGLLANGVANIIKLFITMRSGFLRAGTNSNLLAQQTQYLSSEQLEAATVAASLNQAHTRLSQSFAVETTAVRLLRQAYIDATIAATRFAMANPGMMMPGGRFIPKKFASGVAEVPGTGNKDTVPALLMPGEAVIPKKIAQDNKYAPIINAMVNGTIQGFDGGTTGAGRFRSLPAGTNLNEAINKITAQVAGTGGGANMVAGVRAKQQAQYNREDSSVLQGLRGKTSGTPIQTLQKEIESKYGRNLGVDTEAQQAYKKHRKGFQEIFSRITYDEKSGKYAYSDKKGIIQSTFTKEQLGRQIKYAFKEAPSRDGKMSARKTNPTTLDRYIGRLGKAGSGAPREVRELRQKYNQKTAGLGLDRENLALTQELRKQGLTTNEINKFMGKKAESHIFKPLDSKTKWQSGLTIYDHEGINQYLNRAGKKSVGKLINDSVLLKELGYTDRDISKLKQSYAFAQQEKQPTNAKQLGHLARIADLEVKAHNSGKVNIPNIYQAKGILGVSAVRTPQIWKEISQSIIKLGNKPSFVNKKAYAVMQNKEGILNNKGFTQFSSQNTEPRSSRTPTKNPSLDNRVTNLNPAQVASVRKLGKFGPIPKVAGLSDAPKIDARTSPGMAISAIEKQFRSEQKSLRRQIEKVEQRRLVALKQELKTIEDKNKLATQAAPLTKEDLKNQKREARAQRAQRVGSVAGPVAGIAGIGAMAGFMTGNNSVGMAMMGVSALASIAPMLTNPLGILVGILATASAGFLLYTKMLKNAREEGMNLAKAMSMSASRVKGLSILSGQIGASEIQAKKRQSVLNPLGEPQRKFGQNVLQSEEGKNILSDVERLIKQNFSTQQIGKILGTNLSQAVLQGAISTDQARSIASALGEQIGSYDIPLNVSAKITELMGPNGENLKDSPLQVALAIKKDSMKNLNEALDVFKAGKKNSLLAAIKPPEKTSNNPLSTLIAPFTQFFNQKKENAKLDAAGVQLGFEIIGQNQQLLDSVNEQYDKKVKLAKTEKEINDLQIKRKSDIDKLNIENSKTLTEIIEISKSLSDDTFNTTVKESLNSRIKGASAATKALNEVASQEILKVKDQTLRRTLQIGLASENGLSPQSIISLTSFVASSETASKSIDLFIKANGLAELETLTAIFGKFTGNNFGKDMTPIMREFITKYINENSVGLKDDLAALSALGNFKEQYNVTLDVNSNGVADLQQATNALGLIKNFPDKIDKKFLATVVDPQGNFTQFAKDFDVLSQGKAEVSKYLYVNYKLGLSDPNLVAAAAAAKMTVPEYIAKGFNEALAKPAVNPGPIDTGKRDTTFDDILINLKRTRDATIDVTKGAKELMRILGGTKDITLFKGIDQQLSKMGANSDFIDFVGGLEKAIQNKLITISKKGVVALTDLGKAAKKAYDEKQLGLFSAANAQSITESLKQRDAFVKLKAAGLDTATAQELLADKTFMVSLAAQKNSGEIKTMINEYKNLKATLKETTELIDPLQAFKDEMEDDLKYYDFLEKQARAAAKTEIERINNLIDGNERLIEAQERVVEESINRPIDKFNQDLALIDRSIAKINEKYDAQEKALQTISDINDDIANRESSRITIADALTRGDLSAAAQAIQQQRAEEARRAKEKSSSLLQIAKEKEIAKLTNSNGLTKVQIEEKIYSLEQQRIPLVAAIVELQDKNYTLQNVTLRAQEDSLNATLKGVDAARFAYEQQIIAIEGAQYKANGFNSILLVAEATLARMKALWDSMNQANAKQIEKSTFDNIGTTVKAPNSVSGVSDIATEISKYVSELSAETISKKYINAAQAEQYIIDQKINSLGLGPKYAGMLKGSFGMSVGGMVPKYFASGGYSKGTDTIPTMLTPGEFIVRKNAVDSFGVNNLNKINDGSYGGSSVYNYSLNVNVKSDSSPDDIARTVMTQIRRIDNQRIKGQK